MAVCDLYLRGFSLRSSGHVNFRKGGGKRGKLTGKYSSASFRRLREYVITHSASGECWGLTFTVPGLDNLTVDEFKILHHAFCSWLNKHKFALVWRVELQRRGMPHLHCVFFGTMYNWMRICNEWFTLLNGRKVWSVEKVSAVCSELIEMPRSWVNGASHAVDVCKLDGGFSAFRYLVAHMSKAKRDQLGWRGRNWGVVSRSKFHEMEKRSVWINESQYIKVLRWVRRWTRRKVYARRGCAWWVSDSRVLGSMLDFVIDRDMRGGGAESDVAARGARPVWLYSWFGLEWLSRLDFLIFDLMVAEIRQDCETVLQEIISFFCLYYWREKVPF